MIHLSKKLAGHIYHIRFWIVVSVVIALIMILSAYIGRNAFFNKKDGNDQSIGSIQEINGSQGPQGSSSDLQKAIADNAVAASELEDSDVDSNVCDKQDKMLIQQELENTLSLASQQHNVAEEELKQRAKALRADGGFLRSLMQSQNEEYQNRVAGIRSEYRLKLVQSGCL